MDARQITDTYTVSPQITPEDVADIAAAGFRTIVCNRPDHEIPVELQAECIAAAAEAAGLEFIIHPVIHDELEACVARQMEILETAPTPIFAYCASGTRCSILWSIGQSSNMPIEDILAATTRAGYDLSALRPRLQQIAEEG